MKHKINTVRMTNEQVAEIMSALDHYRTMMGECSYPKTRDAFREHVHIQTLCHGADGEAFDIVPPPPSEHKLVTGNHATILATLGRNRKADDSFRITSKNWQFEAADCDEAAEFFQMLARQLRERA